MTPEQRKRSILSHEAQCLAAGGQYGNDGQAIAIAECVIDGAVNALIRLEGAEEAAKFLFLVQDRVVAGVRLPTAIPVIGGATEQPIAGPKKAYKIVLTLMLLAALAGVVLGRAM